NCHPCVRPLTITSSITLDAVSNFSGVGQYKVALHVDYLRVAPHRTDRQCGRAIEIRQLPNATASGCIEVTCEIFESAIHRDRGPRLTGSEFAGQLQSSDHVQPRRGPCKNAFLPRQPPSHGARRLLVDRAYFVKLAILEMRRAK